MQTSLVPPLCVVNDCGDFSVATCDVPAARQYLCLVTLNGLPFDMKVAQTIEEAQMNHDAFMMAAMLHTAMTDESPDSLN